MGEFIRSSGEYEPTFERQCDEIIALSLSTIGRQYGTGLERSTLTPERPLAYHNVSHTRRVMQQSTEMATRLGLSSRDVKLTEMIASAHDINQDDKRSSMEIKSAEWLASEMILRGMPIYDIDLAYQTIIGTEPLFDDYDLMMGQRVSLFEFDNDRERNIAMSVACGDMGSLYSPISPQLSRLLYMEEQQTAPGQVPPMTDFLRFQKNQLQLLENYRYPHPLGEELFGVHRSNVRLYQVFVTKLHENNELTEWGDILRYDKQFAQQVG